MERVLKRRRQPTFVYEGFGFPVTLVDVPMVHVRGVWTPDVNYNELSDRLMEALARKPARLTGNELRFIRQSLSMTLAQFARRFGVTHPAVIKWERTGNRPSAMGWAIEKDIRLEVLRCRSDLPPQQFLEAYALMEHVAAGRPQRVRLEIPQPA